MKVLGVVLACLVLAGCGSWEGDVRFEVTKIIPSSVSKSGTTLESQVVLKLDQEVSSSANLEPTETTKADQFPSDVAVGDKVVCGVRKVEDNALDGAAPKVAIGPCKRA